MTADTETKLSRLLDIPIADAAGGEDQLGFTQAPSLRTIFANRTNSHLWYFWNYQAEEAEGIDQDALRCEITDLDVDMKISERYGNKRKLHIYVQADRPYRIEAGFETLFARSILNQIAAANPEELQETVVIQVRAGDDENVLFGQLYVESGPVYSEDSTDMAPEEAYRAARENLGLEPEELPEAKTRWTG